MIAKLARSIYQTNYCAFNNIFCFATKNIPGSNLSSEFTEFFSDKNQSFTNGRAWRPQQLRLKSNEDLHKLWFVCVKQKNLLLADQLVQKQFSDESSLGPRLQKVKLTMKRILTIINQRQKIRKQYRQQLQKQYIAKKKQELQEKYQESSKDQIPQITTQMLRAKYQQLRKGVDNVKYLQKIWQKQEFYKQKRQRMEHRLKQRNNEPLKSFWQYQTTIGEQPLQEEVLRTQIKNWKSLNLKQRKIILNFLNTRRAKQAKSAFQKQLKILGEKIAYKQMKERVENKSE